LSKNIADFTGSFIFNVDLEVKVGCFSLTHLTTHLVWPHRPENPSGCLFTAISAYQRSVNMWRRSRQYTGKSWKFDEGSKVFSRGRSVDSNLRSNSYKSLNSTFQMNWHPPI